MATTTVGFTTTTGAAICVECSELTVLHAFGVGEVAEPIEDPTPEGIRNHRARNGERYDEACAVCGWAIRRRPPTAAEAQ